MKINEITATFKIKPFFGHNVYLPVSKRTNNINIKRKNIFRKG